MIRNRSDVMYQRSLWGVVIAIAVVLAWGWVSWNAVPNFKANDDALKTIDALFTAINAHDANRVALCRESLAKHASSGQLNPVAMIEVSRCCEQASKGGWENAARRLYHMIEKQ